MKHIKKLFAKIFRFTLYAYANIVVAFIVISIIILLFCKQTKFYKDYVVYNNHTITIVNILPIVRNDTIDISKNLNKSIYLSGRKYISDTDFLIVRNWKWSDRNYFDTISDNDIYFKKSIQMGMSVKTVPYIIGYKEYFCDNRLSDFTGYLFEFLFKFVFGCAFIAILYTVMQGVFSKIFL